MNIKKELQLLRYSIGQYLANRRNGNFVKLVENYYEAKTKDDLIFLNNHHYQYQQYLHQKTNISTPHSNIEKFKNIHQGKTCFIIGNGPSLNKMDLSKLDGYYTFGMNKIYLIFDRVKLDLDYYVSVNPLVIEQSEQEIKNVITCPSFLSNADEKVFNSSHIHLLKTQPTEAYFHTDIVEGIYEGYTVTFVALQIAFYMGFEKVFLIGVDHNFQQKGNPNEIQALEGEDPNHFDPRYFQGKQWNLADLEGSELSYHMAKFAFERNGRNIYDATMDGKLTIFPKITFDEAIEMSNKK
jgi:uncharacterized Rossmann fold enzyme